MEGIEIISGRYYDCIPISAVELSLSKHCLLVIYIPNAGRNGLMLLSVVLYLGFTSKKCLLNPHCEQEKR